MIRLMKYGLSALAVAAVVAGFAYVLSPKPVPADIAIIGRGPVTVTIDEEGKSITVKRFSGSAILPELANNEKNQITIRIDSKLLKKIETEEGESKDQAALRLRELIDTVGKRGGTGEQVRCVVSVSMLTEGWDANNVTHILGIRAFLQAFHMPATEAIVPLMVPKDKLSRINGLRQFSDGASGVLGPVIAVFLLNFLEFRLILLLDPITFLLAVIPVLLIEIPSPEKNTGISKKNSFREEFSEGISFIMEKSGLLPLVLLFSILNFLFNPLSVLLPLFIIDTHAKGKDEIAFMMALIQIGYMAGSILMMAWKGFNRKIVGIIVAMAGIFFGMFIIAIIPPSSELFYFMGIGFLIVGVTLVILNATILTFYHTIIPPDKLGRFTAVRRTIIWFTIPISSLFFGILAEYLDIQIIFFGCVILGLISIASSWFLTNLPNLEHSMIKPEADISIQPQIAS